MRKIKLMSINALPQNQETSSHVHIATPRRAIVQTDDGIDHDVLLFDMPSIEDLLMAA